MERTEVLELGEFKIWTTWRTVAEIIISGVPKGQPRHRSFVRKCNDGRQFVTTFTPPVADDWKARLIQEARNHLPESPLSGPVRVDWVMLLPRPKYMMRKRDPDGPVLCTAKPDRDNLDKCALDALTQIRFFGDDCQACSGNLEKYYHAKTGRPGALITISVPEGMPEAAAQELTLFGSRGNL